MSVILVTGATGFVGRHLIKALVPGNYPVRCMVRDPGSARTGLPQGVELVKGDINDPKSLREACAGVEGIIHLVAIIREHDGNTFEKVNVEGTINLVVEARQAGVRRFIHLSAMGARNSPEYRYIYSKWLGEESVRQSGLEWTILRPSLIYGEGFGFFDRLLQSLRFFPPPLAPVPGNGRTLFQPIAVEDVVKCILKAWPNPDLIGGIYDLGGPEHLSYRQMLELLLQVRGMKRFKAPIPMAVMRMVTPFMAGILKDPPVTMVELKELDMDNIGDVDAVEKYFGFKPVCLADGIRYLTPPARH
jgi:NADH dehydrogenase